MARDKGGLLYLYLGKPKRTYSAFVGICVACVRLIEDEYDFKKCGVKADDFNDLKWEDEPVEVFLNMED